MVASLVGGAILLFSCAPEKKGGEVNVETMITQQSDSLTMIFSKNGRKEYRFETPLMERYEFARDPYMEFRYGINIITFDSLGRDNSKLRADYAIFYEKRELWETRGNVVGEGADGRKLYTQQLFWNQKTDRVYSYVDSKIVDGDDVFVGEGFESDSEFNDWVFMESEGRMWVDASQSEGDGTTDGAEKPASGKSVKSNSAREGVDADGAKEEPRSIMEREERIRKENLLKENGRRSSRRKEREEKPQEIAPGTAPAGAVKPAGNLKDGMTPVGNPEGMKLGGKPSLSGRRNTPKGADGEVKRPRPMKSMEKE